MNTPDPALPPDIHERLDRALRWVPGATTIITTDAWDDLSRWNRTPSSPAIIPIIQRIDDEFANIRLLLDVLRKLVP